MIGAWCMWYEAKTKYFKKIATTTGSFKILKKTVATRASVLHVCYKMLCTNYIAGDVIHDVGKLEYGVNLHVCSY